MMFYKFQVRVLQFLGDMKQNDAIDSRASDQTVSKALSNLCSRIVSHSDGTFPVEKI